jgi:hypothetical protein
MAGLAAAEVERTLWPAKLVDSQLPSFLVPIQPAWSAELFGVPTMILRRPTELGLSREHVYYRSARPTPLAAPARLLWYLSGRSPEGPAVIACSLLEQLVVDTPEALHQRFHHLGVWRLRHIKDAASGTGRAQALRFADTELLPHPIRLPHLRRLASSHGHTLVLVSAQALPPGLFATLYREGHRQ